MSDEPDQQEKTMTARLLNAVRNLYFAAYWKADRPVDEQALWTELRDAAGIAPGQSAAILGPPAELAGNESKPETEKQNEAEKLLSEKFGLLLIEAFNAGYDIGRSDGAKERDPLSDSAVGCRATRRREWLKKFTEDNVIK